jgi:hypothetical protein
MRKVEDTVGVAGLVVVSVMVLGAFFALTYLVLTRSVPDGNRDLANVLLGSLGTMATGIVYHWTGSSRGSSAKDRIIEQQLANKP